jgi:hypothetical protein
MDEARVLSPGSDLAEDTVGRHGESRFLGRLTDGR